MYVLDNSQAPVKAKENKRRDNFMNKASFYLFLESQQLTREAETESKQNDNIQQKSN
jgi:hypothetical protein